MFIIKKIPVKKHVWYYIEGPSLPDSMQHRFIDKEGNLSKPFANIYGAQFDNNDFEGERRTFFFDDRMSLGRGILNVENSKYEIGLFDYNNNGKFNDDKDVLISV